MTEKQEKMAALMDKADRDLKASEVLLNDEDAESHSSIICFHCQQCIEKYLKAFLISNDKEAPMTHDLEYLASLCSDFDSNFDSFDFRDFAYYGVRIRYDDPATSLDEAKEAVKTAKNLVSFVKQQFINEV